MPRRWRATLARGRVVFFSRSRQRLWEKGETSGHHLSCRAIRIDCDADTLLITARPAGPTCHEGTTSCFGDEPLTGAARAWVSSRSWNGIIDQRIADAPAGQLHRAACLPAACAAWRRRSARKASRWRWPRSAESDEQLVGECADLLFHLMVLLRSRNLPLAAVVAELRRRHEAAGKP